MEDKINHICLNVTNLDGAVKWYQTSFDCKLVSQNETSAVLRFKNIDLHLCFISQVPPHLGFIKKDAASFGELKQNQEGKKSCYVSDATGNLVEIIEE